MYYSKVRLDEMGNSMKRIVCPNCGASIYENEAKCPFCGYINMPGAEEKFMRDMHRTEEQLSQIPEIQKAEYKKHMSTSGKMILVTILIAIAIVCVLGGAYMLFEHVIYSYDEEDVKAQMLWERENFPILDEMYAAGDYDGIIQFEYDLYDENWANKTDYTIYDWEHYYFVNGYRRYRDVENYIDILDKGQKLSDYQSESIVYECMWFHCREYDIDNEFMPYTDEEIAILDGYREVTEKCLYERLGFTEEEVETLYRSAQGEYGGLDMHVCWKYGRKIKDRFK